MVTLLVGFDYISLMAPAVILSLSWVVKSLVHRLVMLIDLRISSRYVDKWGYLVDRMGLGACCLRSGSSQYEVEKIKKMRQGGIEPPAQLHLRMAKLYFTTKPLARCVLQFSALGKYMVDLAGDPSLGTQHQAYCSFIRYMHSTCYLQTTSACPLTCEKEKS